MERLIKFYHFLALVLCLPVLMGAAVSGGGGGGGGLNVEFNTENEITGATSANPLRAGNGTKAVDIFGDPTLGGVVRPYPLGDTNWRIWTNFNGCITDEESSSAPMLCIDPDAASKKAMYAFQTGYYPLKSFFIGAGGWYGDSANCPERPTAVTHNSGPKVPVFVCSAGADGDLDAHVVMPDDWDGGTITLEMEYSQTAADTGSMNSDVKAQCRGAGETPSSTWGSPIAIDDTNVTGSNAVDHTTSAAITPAGTCNPGDGLFLRWTLDVSETSTAEATLRIFGGKITYSSTSLSH